MQALCENHMDLRTQDRKVALNLAIIVIVLVNLELYLDVFSLKDTVLLMLMSVGLGIIVYLIRRKGMYLSSLVQEYTKESNRRDLDMAAVQAAYGRYRLALVTFKVELAKNPDNKILIKIVELMDELESKRRFFTYKRMLSDAAKPRR
jgi:hypothetical protein